jgi:CDP-diglyceride synthetase
MNRILHVLVLAILLFVGSAAIIGGLFLVWDPSGESMKFSLELLEPTTFNNYTIPGIVLILCIGVFSFFVVSSVLKKSKYYPFFIAFQGVILLVWLSVELILNRDFFFSLYHLPLYIMGLILLGVGITLTSPRSIKI